MQNKDMETVIGICQAAAESMVAEGIQWRLDPKYILSLCDAVSACSALVDVQAAEPVAGYRRRLPQYTFEHYEFEQPGYENPSISDWEPLYTPQPPSHREGEDSAETISRRVLDALRAADLGDLLRASDEVALPTIARALAATRSGSAINATGGRDGD